MINRPVLGDVCHLENKTEISIVTAGSFLVHLCVYFEGQVYILKSVFI